MEAIRTHKQPDFTWVRVRVRILRPGVSWLVGIFWLGLNLFITAEAAPAYYELRIYDVTTNKLDAVLERFRDTVEPVRRKHGINTIGYWTVDTTNGDKFVYLIEAASKEDLQQREKKFGADPQFQRGYAASNQAHGKTVDKITTLPLIAAAESQCDFTNGQRPRAFDLRIYSVLPGKAEAFRARWQKFAIPIYQRHGLHSIGCWIGGTKDSDGNDQFVCLLAGQSLTEIQRSIEAFHQDVEWQRIEKETERAGKLRSGVKSLKMIPTDFSSLR